MIDPSKSITKSSKEYCIGDKGQDKLKQAGKYILSLSLFQTDIC